MSTSTQATDDAAREGAIVPRPVRGDVVEAYEAMIEQVPDAGQDGIESILAQLAGITDPNRLDAPWNAGGLAEWAGRMIIVRGIRKMESDYDGPLPWFLILDGQDGQTGQEVHLTTGATSVVAQMVKAHVEGWFPLAVIPRLAKRPTKDGYYPVHLEVARAAAPGSGS